MEGSPCIYAQGASIYDVPKILGFILPPPPSLSTKSFLFVHKFGVFLDPLPPFCPDVIYGSPLTERLRMEIGRACRATLFSYGLKPEMGQVRPWR